MPTELTPNLALPYLAAAQAQKHVTHNEAIRALDALVQLMVLDKDLAAPPAAPHDGARYLVAAGGSGAWAGQDGRIAAWQDGAWAFFTPGDGWLAWVADERVLYVRDGANWTIASSGTGTVNPTPLVGVNATADTTNRLAVSSPATLFNHAGSGHQLKLNKAAATDTTSILLQTGFSGRAEIGATGDDNLHVKVSPDGSNWKEALIVDRTSGVVSLPFTPAREILTANRTYYVRTDGNDANSGLGDDSAGAFRTIRKALDVVYGSIDLGPYNATIQVRPGTYAESLTISTARVGRGSVVLVGDEATPGNVVIAGASDCLRSIGFAAIEIRGFRLNPGPGRFCLYVSGIGEINFRALEFGETTGNHMFVLGGGAIQAVGTTYAIVGGAARHINVSRGGSVIVAGQTVTLTGTPAFSSSFVSASALGIAVLNSCTFVGSATGKRYDVTGNSVIVVNGAAATYLPGDVAGTAASGGSYA